MITRRELLERTVLLSMGPAGCNSEAPDPYVPEQVVGIATSESEDAADCGDSCVGYVQDPHQLNEDGIPVFLDDYITRHQITAEDDFNGRELDGSGYSILPFSDSFIIHQKGADHYFEIDLREIDPLIPEGEIPQELYNLGREIATDFLAAIGVNDIAYLQMEDVSE